jgi:biuret amidohydrolase
MIVVRDCVETMDGAALHEAGLLCIRTAFGFVLETAEIQKLGIFASADKSAA